MVRESDGVKGHRVDDGMMMYTDDASRLNALIGHTPLHRTYENRNYYSIEVCISHKIVVYISNDSD